MTVMGLIEVHTNSLEVRWRYFNNVILNSIPTDAYNNQSLS